MATRAPDANRQVARGESGGCTMGMGIHRVCVGCHKRRENTTRCVDPTRVPDYYAV